MRKFSLRGKKEGEAEADVEQSSEADASSVSTDGLPQTVDSTREVSSAVLDGESNTGGKMSDTSTPGRKLSLFGMAKAKMSSPASNDTAPETPGSGDKKRFSIFGRKRTESEDARDRRASSSSSPGPPLETAADAAAIDADIPPTTSKEAEPNATDVSHSGPTPASPPNTSEGAPLPTTAPADGDNEATSASTDGGATLANPLGTSDQATPSSTSALDGATTADNSEKSVEASEGGDTIGKIGPPPPPPLPPPSFMKFEKRTVTPDEGFLLKLQRRRDLVSMKHLAPVSSGPPVPPPMPPPPPPPVPVMKVTSKNIRFRKGANSLTAFNEVDDSLLARLQRRAQLIGDDDVPSLEQLKSKLDKVDVKTLQAPVRKLPSSLIAKIAGGLAAQHGAVLPNDDGTTNGTNSTPSQARQQSQSFTPDTLSNELAPSRDEELQAMIEIVKTTVQADLLKYKSDDETAQQAVALKVEALLAEYVSPTVAQQIVKTVVKEVIWEDQALTATRKKPTRKQTAKLQELRHQRAALGQEVYKQVDSALVDLLALRAQAVSDGDSDECANAVRSSLGTLQTTVTATDVPPPKRLSTSRLAALSRLLAVSGVVPDAATQTVRWKTDSKASPLSTEAVSSVLADVVREKLGEEATAEQEESLVAHSSAVVTEAMHADSASAVVGQVLRSVRLESTQASLGARPTFSTLREQVDGLSQQPSFPACMLRDRSQPLVPLTVDEDNLAAVDDTTAAHEKEMAKLMTRAVLDHLSDSHTVGSESDRLIAPAMAVYHVSTVAEDLLEPATCQRVVRQVACDVGGALVLSDKQTLSCRPLESLEEEEEEVLALDPDSAATVDGDGEAVEQRQQAEGQAVAGREVAAQQEEAARRDEEERQASARQEEEDAKAKAEEERQQLALREEEKARRQREEEAARLLEARQREEDARKKEEEESRVRNTAAMKAAEEEARQKEAEGARLRAEEEAKKKEKEEQERAAREAAEAAEREAQETAAAAQRAQEEAAAAKAAEEERARQAEEAERAREAEKERQRIAREAEEQAKAEQERQRAAEKEKAEQARVERERARKEEREKAEAEAKRQREVRQQQLVAERQKRAARKGECKIIGVMVEYEKRLLTAKQQREAEAATPPPPVHELAAKAGVDAVALALQTCAELDRWEKLAADEVALMGHMDLYGQEADSSGIAQFAAVCQFTKPRDQVLQCLTDTHLFCKWDDSIEHAALVDVVNTDQQFWHLTLDLALPFVDHRDLLLLHTSKEVVGKHVVVLSSTRLTKRIPDDAVRADAVMSFVVQSSQISPFQTQVIAFCRFDAKGSLPTALSNNFSRKRVEKLAQIEYLPLAE